jgi:hypothetical protein
VRDPKWLREADDPRSAVHQAKPDSLDGYVIWRVEPRWTAAFPANLMRVRELIAPTPQAEARCGA